MHCEQFFVEVGLFYVEFAEFCWKQRDQVWRGDCFP